MGQQFPKISNFVIKNKQGLVQDYSQRIEEGNIYRQKLSRLKLYRLRLHRHRPGWAKGHGLRLYSLSLYGSETGVGGRGWGWGGSSEIIYSSPSIRKKCIFVEVLVFWVKDNNSSERISLSRGQNKLCSRIMRFYSN